MIAPAIVQAASTGFSVKFRDAYKNISGNTGLQLIADEIDLPNRTTTFPISGKTSRMRQWNGERIARERQIYGYQVTAGKFEDTVKVKVEDLEDDNLGVYNSQFADLGEAAGYLPYDQVIAVLLAAGVNLCYDGVPFFSAAHPVDPFNAAAGTQSNLPGAGAITQALVATQMAAMTQMTDEFGNLLRIRPTHIMTGTTLERQVDEIIAGDLIFQTTAATNAAAPTNVMKGRLQKIIVPELDATLPAAWYLLDLSKPVKPFFWGWKVRPQFQPATMNQQHEFDLDELVYGVRARGVAGYGLWQLARRCN